MTPVPETLWSRALQAVGARGLLPIHRRPLTPGEVATEVARRGEGRLTRLVYGWYYPASYGHVRGALSDEEASRLVVSLEAELPPAQTSATENVTAPAETASVESLSALRKRVCELCGQPVLANPWKRRV